MPKSTRKKNPMLKRMKKIKRKIPIFSKQTQRERHA
jgi:hypothetical protein